MNSKTEKVFPLKNQTIYNRTNVEVEAKLFKFLVQKAFCLSNAIQTAKQKIQIEKTKMKTEN